MSDLAKVFYTLPDNKVGIDELFDVVDIKWNSEFLEIQTEVGFTCYNYNKLLKFSFLEDNHPIVEN